jgi:hypothetical protein
MEKDQNSEHSLYNVNLSSIVKPTNSIKTPKKSTILVPDAEEMPRPGSSL